MILTLAELAEVRQRLRGLVVLANGCFDLLHTGHVRHLLAAKAMGDVLFISLTSDRYVNKGPGRPVVAAQDRAFMVNSLRCADYVYINDLPPPALEQFELLRPDIYVKGRDYEGSMNEHLLQQKAAVEKYGGRFVLVGDKLGSSTELARRIAA